MAGDLYFHDVVLLLHGEGSDGGTTFTDSSEDGRTVTATNATTQVEQFKFGSASAYFDGAGDYLSVTLPALGTGSFTIDGFFRLTTPASSFVILDNRTSDTDTSGFAFYVRSTSKLAFGYYSGGAFSATEGTTTVLADTWYYYRLTRSGNTVRGYLGTSGTPTEEFNLTYSVNVTRTASRIGHLWNASGTHSAGYVDEYRVTAGVVRGGDVPSAAFADYCEIPGTGALASAAAVIAGSGIVNTTQTGTGALAAASATISGTGRAFTTLTGAGALTSQVPSIAGVGGIAAEPSLPITMGVLLPVRVGLPIRIDIYSAVTPSLPITIGPYPVTPTLPIVFKTPVAVTLPSLTITFPGAYSGVLTAAGTDVITWTPKCVLDGVDISAKLIGAQDIEFEETAAPVATFSFIPAAGSIDPLLYVGKSVSLSITIGTATYLAFSGVVSDPVWNADDRTITISATGDLQSRLDAMDKTAILAQLGGTFSEYIFDDPNNMSGWEFAEALISTQPKVIWQDANGFIRADSILAKASADYTFEEADILDTAQVVRWQGRLDFINKLTVSLGYRFQRRRQRNKKFSFHPYQLSTPSMFLSGNEGGWELPQRTQIESAANGGGWTVIGDIRFSPLGVPPWEYKAHPTYSDQGIAMMSGLVAGPDDGNLCVGADWTAAKRWLQTVTEKYTLVVTASDSIEAVGTLATEESYAIEDETTDEAWESSLDYDGYVSGAVVMSNGVDYKSDLDALRTDVTTAMSVALAKAQNDVLKSHRGTTVGFTTTYDPRLDLSHTVAVDTTYLDCKGKVRRIAHHWDIDTGDATTEVEIALSRHNGSGLASTDVLTPPSEPVDPTETAPATYRKLEMHIGGQDDRPVWDETWDGYVVNVAMVGLDKFGGAAYPSTSTTSLASQYYLSNTWQRDPSNPALIGKIYEPGFHILPDTIDATYADPADVTAAQTYDVEIPEDTLTLISG